MIRDYNINSDGFFLEDIAHALHIKLNSTNIANIESDEKDYDKALKEINDYCKKIGEKKIIIATADIKIEDYPQDKYVLKYGLNKYELEMFPDKKLIPVDKVLKEQSKIYEEAGFVNVNDYVGYEYKVAFIYPNEYGKEVINEFNRILKLDNKNNNDKDTEELEL